MSRPLGARKPRGSMNKTDAVVEDGHNADKQRAEKADLLGRMRHRIRGRPTTG
ncbi:hypothetical protein [Streptomyces nigrescens]|uniref:hypothetical protein n=1 Tax=Streptomyces nigrescens TaxID=1920 RepID=UPI003499CD68